MKNWIPRWGRRFRLPFQRPRSEEHTSELQSPYDLVCRLLLEKKNIQTACLIMEGAEFTENIINGVERPVKAAELFAFTLRVRAGITDVLTDAEEYVRQKLRAEGGKECLKVKNDLALALVGRSRCEELKASVKARVFVFNDATTSKIYTLSLHDALPI